LCATSQGFLQQRCSSQRLISYRLLNLPNLHQCSTQLVNCHLMCTISLYQDTLWDTELSSAQHPYGDF
jgi:hypothetical protein